MIFAEQVYFRGKKYVGPLPIYMALIFKVMKEKFLPDVKLNTAPADSLIGDQVFQTTPCSKPRAANIKQMYHRYQYLCETVDCGVSNSVLAY